MKTNKKLINFLSERNELEHRLPQGNWENYAVAISRVLGDRELSAIIKTIRLQKIIRYIYDNETPTPRDERESEKD